MWSTVKYATNAENGLVGGSLDNKTTVDRTFRTHVLENRYLKVTLLPEFGGRIVSIIYKPTGHEQLYRAPVGVPYGIKGGTLYGATDELGYAAVENKVHVHDLHATILHLLGFDHEKLTYRYSGRDFRLTDVSGRVVKEISA